VSIGTLFVLALSVIGYAQSPAPAAQQTAQPAGRLPIRRVVLYKSGVGYFEHLGRIRGSQTVTVDFTSGQLDDVLKSLTALDLDGGRVSGVSYNSDAGLDRRLAGLRLPVGQQATRAQFLAALRGARLEVRDGASRIVGRLLSVEPHQQRRGDAVVSVDMLSIVTDAGELQTVPLDAGVGVRILEADLSQEVSRYLSLVASVRDQDIRRLSIATTGAGDRDLFVSYVSEVPVWKATYRIVLPDAKETRRPLLQGWAIVDNTVGEDWENVQLSLVAGAPQSFVQAISRPYYVQRPVVPLPERVLMSPQTHQGALALAGNGALTGTVTDQSGGTIPGVSVSVTGQSAQTVTTDRNGRYRFATLAPGTYQVQFRLPGFNTVNFSRVDVSGGMETVLNTPMQVGRIEESVTVSGLPQNNLNITMDGVSTGVAGGRGGGVMRSAAPSAAPVAPAPPPAQPSFSMRAGQQVDAMAAQLGDLFEYKLKEPITIRKNQSAMVPILNGEVQAEKVSLWNASSGATRALRAIWLTNATGNTLDAGSFSIVEGQAFAGEGLMESLKAGERRLLSYAVDLGLVLDAKGEAVPTRTTRVRVSKGMLIQQVEERQRRVYSARNEDSEARLLVVEHPVRSGWTLGGTIKPEESTPSAHRFRVPIAPRTTATFAVDESRTIDTQIAVAALTDDQVALFIRDKMIDATLQAQLQEVQRRKTEIFGLMQRIDKLEEESAQIERDQQRVRENMRALKGSSEEKQLVQRYVKQLNEQETRIDASRTELASLIAERQKAEAALQEYIDKIG